MSSHRDARIVHTSSTTLLELHNESVRIAAHLMTMAGADPIRVNDDVLFWTFANTGEHATIDAAISRIGAHPAVAKLVEEYRRVTTEMMALEQRVR